MFGHRSLRFGSPFRYAISKYFQASILGLFPRAPRFERTSQPRAEQTRLVHGVPMTKMQFMESRGLGAAYRAKLAGRKLERPSDYRPAQISVPRVKPPVYKAQSAKLPSVGVSPFQSSPFRISQPSRPAAMKRNGGLRGSTATKSWRR